MNYAACTIRALIEHLARYDSPGVVYHEEADNVDGAIKAGPVQRRGPRLIFGFDVDARHQAEKNHGAIGALGSGYHGRSGKSAGRECVTRLCFQKTQGGSLPAHSLTWLAR